jgi:hypothetical protein
MVEMMESKRAYAMAELMGSCLVEYLDSQLVGGRGYKMAARLERQSAIWLE